MEIRFTDANGLPENNAPTFVILLLTRQEIETGNFASTLERLHALTDNRETVLRYRESVVFQIDGYDDDPRELAEIPEVRRFFAQLVEEWPHWCWFLPRGMGSLALLLSLLCQVRILRGPEGVGTAFDSGKEIKDHLEDMLTRGNALFVAYDIPSRLVGDSAHSLAPEFAGIAI